MRPGWNPVRRNRNIGTARQGHGENKQMVIPESWHRCQRFWENLSACVAVECEIGAKIQIFLVEPPQVNWFYPGSIDDMAKLLVHFPVEDLLSFDFIVLRQPTRKQRMLAPVWGRAVPMMKIGKFCGSAVVIEAQTPGLRVWSENRSLSPDQHLELERLQQEGHQLTRRRRDILISSSAQAIRNTVLYRTLPHEIGHHVDRLRTGVDDWNSKPSSEKEAYAHRYAKDFLTSFVTHNVLPLAADLDDLTLSQDGLRREWFVAPRQGCPT